MTPFRFSSACCPAPTSGATIRVKTARPYVLRLFNLIFVTTYHEAYNPWLQRRGGNPLKLRRRKYHKTDAIAASAASHCSTARLAEMHVINEMRIVCEICFASNINDDCTDRLGDLRSRPRSLFAFERMW